MSQVHTGPDLLHLSEWVYIPPLSNVLAAVTATAAAVAVAAAVAGGATAAATAGGATAFF